MFIFAKWQDLYWYKEDDGQRVTRTNRENRQRRNELIKGGLYV